MQRRFLKGKEALLENLKSVSFLEKHMSQKLPQVGKLETNSHQIENIIFNFYKFP